MTDFNLERSELKRKFNRKRRTHTIIIIIMIVAGITAIINSQSAKRWFKSMKSNYTGGMQRTVTVYDNNGNELRVYKGKIDVEESEYGNKVLFDLDGKRHTIYNAAVIIDEE